MNATIDLIGAQGYAATTISEVLAHAGVSRKTFYRHFTNKRECFLAAYDAIVPERIERVASASAEAHGLPGDAGSIEVLFEHLIETPCFPRLVLVEIRAVGSAGIARREQMIGASERLLCGNSEFPRGHGIIPNPLLRAFVGGLMKVLSTRAHSGAPVLRSLLPELVSWSTSYYPAPAAIKAALQDPQQSASGDRLMGGRAPGTLRLDARSTPETNGSSGAGNGMSRSFVVHSQRERILDAVANLTAAEGYAKLKIEDVAEEAGVSLHACYEHFAGKEDAFLVAYEVGHGKARAIAERAYASACDWPVGVRAGIAALFDFLATEPSFARMALVDVLIGTARSAERSNVGVSAFAKLLIPGLKEAGTESPYSTVTIDAIAGGIFELCFTYAVQDRIAELSELVPTATYVALAPFIGVEQAARVALEPVTA